MYWVGFLLMVSVAVTAREKARHEIGVGIGTIILNPYNESDMLNNEPKWEFNTIFKQNTYRHWLIQSRSLQSTTSYSTPPLYYLNTISKRTAFRFSYQYTFQKGMVADRFQNEQGKAAIFRYIFKQSNLNVGFSYILFMKEYLDIYVASDLETIWQKRKEDRIMYGGEMCDVFQYLEEDKGYPGTQLHFYLNQIVGFKIPFTQHVNVRYEFSGKFVGVEARLQPINRLSVNYAF